jgi:carboxymethylenebutenolidase
MTEATLCDASSRTTSWSQTSLLTRPAYLSTFPISFSVSLQPACMFLRLTVIVKFQGDPVPWGTFALPATPGEIRGQSFLGKLSMIGKMVTVVPWFIRHRPAAHLPQAKEFVALLKSPEYGYTKLGAIGYAFCCCCLIRIPSAQCLLHQRYCYGAKLVVEMDFAGLTDVNALVHPSMLSAADFDAIKNPTAFSCAELDPQFTDELRTQVETKLRKRGHEYDLVVYEGTTHGFAFVG